MRKTILGTPITESEGEGSFQEMGVHLLHQSECAWFLPKNSVLLWSFLKPPGVMESWASSGPQAEQGSGSGGKEGNARALGTLPILLCGMMQGEAFLYFGPEHKILSAKPHHSAGSWNHQRMKPGMTHLLGEWRLHAPALFITLHSVTY